MHALERRQLGRRLREARKYLGLKQDEVAIYLKIPRTALTDIENGQRRVEAIELTRLAKLYRQSVSFFTGEDAAAAALPTDVAHLARQAASLSEQDREELGRFAEYLRARSQAARNNMASDYARAVRSGTMAAGRLHRQLGDRVPICSGGGNVDVFGTMLALDLPIVFRPLEGLLGAYLREPTPGVLVTTQRPMSVQRFTAAHELGHFWLKHSPSLDDESILRRLPFTDQPNPGFQEVEADAFAVAFMMPRWLIDAHCKRQGWQAADLEQPAIVYQLSLRLGASYEATYWTLLRYKLISRSTTRRLTETVPRQLKITLLQDYHPVDYRGDVWLLSERDAGTRIDGSRNDLFVLHLKEHSGGGYLWDIDQLKASGFAVVRDEREAMDADGAGSHVLRRITATLEENRCGYVSLDERRPWQPGAPLTQLTLNYDLNGPEEKGFSRTERRHRLQAA
jgi:Zn-dependent peptidase ImmA (M78 family)/DNA-binding XRE family transcriptional regulator